MPVAFDAVRVNLLNPVPRPGVDGGRASGLRRVARWLAGWLLTWLVAGGAHASSGVAQLDHWVDGDGRATAEQVAAGVPWAPAANPLLLGYRDAAVWLRVHPEPLPGAEDASLRIGAPYLDHVDVFRPLAGGGYERVRLGDRVPYGEWEQPGRLFHAHWNAAQREAAAGRPLLVRVQSSSSLAISVEVRPEGELDRQELRDYFVGGLYVGVVLLLLLWATAQLLLFRDTLAGQYIGYLAVSTAAMLLLSGFLNDAVPAALGTRDAWASVLILLTTSTALLLHHRLIRDLGPFRGPLRVVLLGLAVSVANLALYGLGQHRLALQLNASSVILIMGVLLPLVMLGGLRQPDLPGRIGAAAYVVLGLFIVTSTLPVVGLGQVMGFAYSYYVPALHTFVTAITVASLMLVRRLKLQQQLDESRREVEAARTEATVAHRQREDKERFLSMLAHELRTPLSVVRMVLEALPVGPARTAADGVPDRRVEQARRAVEDMNQVISRTLLTDRVERGDLPYKPQRMDLRELLVLLASDHPQGDRVSLHLADEPVMLESDPLLVRTILANLVDNALKYSPPQSLVDVHLESEAGAGAPTVRVCNAAGPAGLPDPQRVFAKYYRSERAHKQTGSGLGLYLVSGLAERIGAGVAHHSDGAAQRVCFEVRWPR